MPIKQWYIQHVVEYTIASSEVAVSVDGEGEQLSSQRHSGLFRPPPATAVCRHSSMYSSMYMS